MPSPPSGEPARSDGTAPALGPAPPGPFRAVDENRGGARLKAVFAEAPDGSSHFLEWRDALLDVACAFRTLADGAMFCLPQGSETGHLGELFFADAACTEALAPLAATGEGSASPRFAYGLTTGDSCAQKPSVYRVGSRQMPQVGYRKTGNGCVAGALPQQPFSPGIFRVEPVGLELFVAASIAPGPALGGIVPAHVVAQDGARAVWGFRDAAGGFDCSLATTSDGLRCVPNLPLLVGFGFADRECKIPAAITVGCLQGLPTSIRHALSSAYEKEQNGAVTRVFQAAERLTTSFVGSPSSCVASSSEGAFALGPEIPASMFSAAAKTVLPLASGLDVHFDHAGGWSVQRALTSRSPFKHNCSFGFTSDGVLRCLPQRAQPALYSDVRCTRPVMSNQPDLIAVTDGPGTPPRARLFVRGSTVHTTTVYSRKGTTCAFAADAPPNSARTLHHDYAEELAPEKLVPFKVVMR